MKIGSLQGYMPELPELKGTDKKDDSSFGDMMVSFIKDVNGDQLTSNKMVQDFADGKEVELHEVMIAGERAKTSLDLLMEIRNKAIDMYKELTRIPV